MSALFLLLFLMPGLSAFAGEDPAQAPAYLSSDTVKSSEAVTAAPVSYGYGMEQRKKGDIAGAKATFLKLLEQDPYSGGAFEGLALTSISLGQYEEARGYLERWSAQSPNSAYILGLLVRAQNALRNEDGALETYKAIVECDPRDCALRDRLDSSMERLRAGVFPRARSYKSYSMEGLDTTRPQRILYEGNSGGSRFRAPLRPRLDLVGGVEIRQEAQRNDGQGFTYYDILDQVYSAGLSARPTGNLNWEAEYGQSVLSDIKGSGVGNKLFSRARLAGTWHVASSDFRLVLNRSPKFLRGPGGSQYFKLLGENSVRAEAETGRWGLGWLARAGIYDTSDGTTLGTYSLRGTREAGSNIFQTGYSHSQQEFYSASADGHLRYVNTDRLNIGFRRLVEERYRIGTSYARTSYSDTNRLQEFDADLTGWLPRNEEFYGSYRFSLQDFRGPYEGYSSTDRRSHWLGAYWRRCHGRNWAAMAGYERGFLNDSRGSYQGNRYLVEAEWYRGAYASVRAQARKTDTTVGDKSYSVGLQARYSFK